MSLNMLRTYGDKVSFNIELVHSKFNVVVKRTAGRVNGGTIVLCRERTERSRTIPSFRKKTNA